MRQSPPGVAESGRQGFGWLKSLALLPVPLFIVLIIYFSYAGPATVIEPPYLLLALNSLFTTVIPFTVAYLAWRSYANSGQWRLFLLGCGMVAFGFGSMEAGFVINLPGGINLAVAVYNTCALLAAVLIITAAIFSVIKSAQVRLERNRALYLGLCYVAVIVLMSLFSIAVYLGIIPAFFEQGTGPTLLRQLVLGAAILLLAASSVMFLVVYLRSRADFTYWLSIALLLVAVGLCTVFLQKSVGGANGWTGRAAQYLGCVYLLIGIAGVTRVSSIKRIPLADEFSRSFSYIEANYKILIEMASDAIISVDNKGTILTWNPAAADIFGYSVSEAAGANVIDFIFPREAALLINAELQKLAKAKIKESEPGNKIVTIARRKTGEEFPAEVSLAMKKVTGEWLGTLVIRDITERRHAELEIADEKRFSESLIDTAQAIILVLDTSGHIVTFNPYMERISGYKIDEVRGKDWFYTFLPTHNREKTRELFLAAIDDIQTKGNIDEIVTRDGKICSIEWYDKTLKDAQGSVVGLLCTGQDVTERKRVEETLRESEERFAAAFNINPDPTAISVPETGQYIDVNPAFETWTGYSRDEIIGKTSHELNIIFNPADRDVLVNRLRNHEPVDDVEISFRVRSGELRYTLFSARIAIIDGKEYLLTRAHDITERKRAEEAILRSKLLLQSVVDSTPDWMYVKDYQHKFILVNKSFAEAQNLTPQDMINRADTDFFAEELCLGNPDKGIRGFHADDNQAFQGRTVHNPGNMITWADGSLHIYDTYKIPLAGPSGEIYAALVYSRDITGQRKAEHEREASFKTLHKTLHDVINTMSKIVEMRDPYTSGHQGRVAGLAGAIARDMKLDDSRVEHLIMAASIHDVGKMYVPADILSKPGKLSDIEWAMIKTHVEGSYEILKDLEFDQPIAIMTLQHHERLDGSGYPNGLKGEEMMVEAKILAVADVVEAMSSHRPYRPALGIDKALEEISGNRGKLYDPDVVDTCLKLFRQQGFQFD